MKKNYKGWTYNVTDYGLIDSTGLIKFMIEVFTPSGLQVATRIVYVHYSKNVIKSLNEEVKKAIEYYLAGKYVGDEKAKHNGRIPVI